METNMVVPTVEIVNGISVGFILYGKKYEAFQMFEPISNSNLSDRMHLMLEAELQGLMLAQNLLRITDVDLRRRLSRERYINWVIGSTTVGCGLGFAKLQRRMAETIRRTGRQVFLATDVSAVPMEQDKLRRLAS